MPVRRDERRLEQDVEDDRRVPKAVPPVEEVSGPRRAREEHPEQDLNNDDYFSR